MSSLGFRQVTDCTACPKAARTFQDGVSRLQTAVGLPDMNVFRKDGQSAKTYSEVEKIVTKVEALLTAGTS